MPITKIYAMCPNGAHVHSRDNPEKALKKIAEGFTPEMCIICNPEKNLINFQCDKYGYYSRFYLSRESKINLLCALSRRDSPYWLPTELHRFILNYFKNDVYPLWIHNEVTKRHFEKCSKCGENLINFIDKHSCSNHIVVRKS